MSHDAEYKKLFSSKQIISEFLKYFTIPDEEFINQIDIDSLEMVNTKYKNRHSDLVWKAKLKNTQQNIFLLLVEFQSKIDFLMPIRIANYTSELILNLHENKELNLKQESMPIVLPIVIYNGNRQWNAKTEILSMYKALPKNLIKYQLNQSYILIDLSCYQSNEDIKSILDIIFSLEANLNVKIDMVKLLLQKIKAEYPNYSNETQILINSFLSYFRNKFNKNNNLIFDNQENVIMGIDATVEAILNEAKEIGLEQGKLENALATAKSLISMNILTIEQICQATGLTLEQLKEHHLI